MRNWIAVASAEHARRGRDQSGAGFMQVCHGKLAPIRRVHPGDRIAYYAPRLSVDAQAPYQCMVSIGRVLPGEPYAVDMGGGFVPYRRDVAYQRSAREVPIGDLLDRLHFVESRQHWGAKFRFGLFDIDDHDMGLIATAMGVPAVVLGLA